MEYTTNYQLPTWVETDRIQMDDFNDMTDKIDTALDNLQAEVNASGTIINTKGNCVIYTTSYIGTGNYGSSNPNTLVFPFQPLAVFIANCGSNLIAAWILQGMQKCNARGRALSENTLSWSETGLSWFSDSANGQMNTAGETYQVLALMTMNA